MRAIKAKETLTRIIVSVCPFLSSTTKKLSNEHVYFGINSLMIDWREYRESSMLHLLRHFTSTMIFIRRHIMTYFKQVLLCNRQSVVREWTERDGERRESRRRNSNCNEQVSEREEKQTHATCKTCLEWAVALKNCSLQHCTFIISM